MKKLLAVIVLLISGCVTSNDSNSTGTKTVVVYDTLRTHDTVTTFITKHDTLKIHDTTNIIVFPKSDSGSLIGLWRAKYNGVRCATFGGCDSVLVSLTMIITSANGGLDASYGHFSGTREENYHGEITTFNVSGDIKVFRDGVASVSWISKDLNWVVAFDSTGVYLQEVGDGFFLSKSAIQFTH